MNKNEYVYCTNCKYGSKLIEYIIRYNGVSIPEQCNGCYPYNPEDSMKYEDRPNYKEKREINKK